MNFYAHHIGDYLTDTAHLSMLEDGAYRRLLDKYYTNEAPLCLDEAMLFRQLRARSDDEKDAIRIVLSEFFSQTDGGWIHKRCDAEIALYREKSAKAADAANKRWSKQGNADVMRPHSECIADGMLTNTITITKNHTQDHNQNQEPRAVQKQSEEQQTAPAVAAPRKKKSASKDEPNPLNLETWKAYKQAYAVRYGVPPVQNAKSNSVVKAVVQALGVEAPDIAAFFVQHSGRNYVAAMHQIGLLLHDHAKLRTEWATGRRVTLAAAGEADRLQDAGDMWGRIIEKHQSTGA